MSQVSGVYEGLCKCRVLVLHYFGGYPVAEIADLVKVSEATVAHDLSFARVWLYREIWSGPHG